MNARELRSAVRLRNGIPDTGDGLAEHDTINDCIRAALVDLSSEQRWPWLLTSASITFTAGVGPLPADCTVISELVANGYPAERVGLDDFLVQTRGCVWTEQGSNIKLYPVPVTAPTATLYYYRTEPALTTDESTPLLPTQHHQILVCRASYHLNVRRTDKDRIRLDLEEWVPGLRNMMLTTWRSQGPRTVKSAYRARQTGVWS